MNRTLDARRPLGRFFCCLILVLLSVPAADAAGPATTSVTDTVYRADGTPAAGTLVIAWPAFTTAEGKAVPAGRTTVKIGAAGALSVPLVPNFGATPEGTYYRVTYKLDDGSTSEEYWSVPAAPSTTIGAIRSKLVPANVAVQYATRQYVDSMLANIGGGAGNAVKIQGKDVDTAEPLRGQSLTFDGTKYKPQSHPFVDVVRDCGAAGDNVTDDGPALRACAYAASSIGKVLYFPKTCSTANGACYDYYVGTADNGFAINLPPTQGGTSFAGGGNTYGAGGVSIRVAAGMGGIHVRAVPAGVATGFIHNLSFYSPDFELNNPATWGVPGTHHGIWYEGTKPDMNNVHVAGFDGDGILIDSTTSYAPDLCTLYNVTAYSNKGNGIHLQGNDSNVCGLYNPNVRLNQLWGIKLENEFGGTIVAPHADANHHDGFGSLSGNLALTSCQRVGSTTTCTTGVNHNFVERDNVFQAGCADSSFNGARWRIHVVNATQYSYRTPGNENTNGGTTNSGACSTVQYSVNGRVWSSNSLDGGPYFSSYNNVLHNTWIGIYTEGSAADQLSSISNNDVILYASIWLGNRLEQGNQPTQLTADQAGGLQLRYGTFNGQRFNPATGANFNSYFLGGDASPTGIDAAFSFKDSASPNNYGSWVRSGPHLGDCSALTFGANPGQWGFRMSSASDNASCAFTPFWVSDYPNGESVNGPAVGFPNGYYMGNYGSTGLHYRTLGSAAWASGTQAVGYELDKITPVSGGYYGWLCVTAGTPCAAARAFGPIANDSAGTSWTLPVLNAATSFTIAGGTAQTGLSGTGTSLLTNVAPSVDRLISTVPTGTAPFTVASTTPVVNLSLASDSQLPTISTAGKVAATALPAAQRVRICEVHIGSATGSALSDSDDEAASCFNDYGASLNISGVRCYANAGAPTVQLARNDSTNILSGALACGTASWAPADGQSGRPSIAASSLANGQWLDVNIVTAGGTAKYIRVVITFTL